MKITELEPDMIANMYFDAVDLKKTLEVNNATHFKRVHAGTESEDTVGDLIDDIIYHLERIQ